VISPSFVPMINAPVEVTTETLSPLEVKSTSESSYLPGPPRSNFRLNIGTFGKQISPPIRYTYLMHTIHTVQDGQLRIGLAEDCRRTLATLRRTQLFPVPRQYAQSPAFIGWHPSGAPGGASPNGCQPTKAEPTTESLRLTVCIFYGTHGQSPVTTLLTDAL
jgi:hypothetical protein